MESPGEKSSVVRVPASGVRARELFSTFANVILNHEPRHFCLDALKNFFKPVYFVADPRNYVRESWIRSFNGDLGRGYTKLRRLNMIFLFFFFYYCYYFYCIFWFWNFFEYVNKINEKWFVLSFAIFEGILEHFGTRLKPFWFDGARFGLSYASIRRTMTFHSVNIFTKMYLIVGTQWAARMWLNRVILFPRCISTFSIWTHKFLWCCH